MICMRFDILAWALHVASIGMFLGYSQDFFKCLVTSYDFFQENKRMSILTSKECLATSENFEFCVLEF